MGVQINGSEGNVIATKGTYSGNVTIGGTLTYEDVTNIDSVGLVTARGAVLEDFILEVTEIYNDKFTSWEFGEFDYIDPITNLQDGVRTRFPLRVKGELLSFDIGEGSDSQLINMNNLLAIYINNILQEPGEAYVFDGGITLHLPSNCCSAT